MKKKIPLLFLTLLSIVFAGTARGAFVDAASLMKQADKLNDSRSYQKAKEIYQTIATNYSHTDCALPAQRKLVCVSIALDDYQQAETEFGKLITDFTGYGKLPKQIHEIGTICRVLGKHEKGKYYYNYVIENFPDSEQVIFSQKDLVKTAIETEDHAAEQQALDEFKTKYANHPKLPEALCSIADGCAREGKYDKANEMNKYIILNFPESNQTQRAQKRLIQTAITTGDGDIAAAMEQLTADFADYPSKFINHPNLSKLLCNIADGYRKAEKYDRAVGLNIYLVNTFPQTDHAPRAQKNLVQCYMATGSSADANAAIEKLLTDFIDHPGQWDAVKRTADMLCDESKFDTATRMYQHLIETYPDDTDNINWRKGLAIVKINMGDDAEVQNDVEALIADFNDNAELPRAVFHIGEEYFFIAENYYKDRQMAEARPLYQKALNIWERIISRENLEPFRYGQLYAFSAESYYRLGEYIKAADYFQKVANDWPGYRYGTIVQYMIGVCYEKLKRSPDVAISIDEVDERIAKAYEAVIERYPEKPLATGAALKLGQLYFAKEQWPEAIVYFEIYRAGQPGHYRVLYTLGQAYEKIKANELAIEVYEQYLAKAKQGDRRIERVQARLDELKGGQ